ncbi:phosphopantetheine-binding protein [Pseudomonas sp. 148P]|uniref:Phosphopantetheine-binding protein n=1 Tax=Pseudomonas ulcerans TaxID=3115852 RepID=A0ABU7I0Y4_9PSED|nr:MULTISPECIES: phosphopantetheine-binding protein [unclassified Pseudomonas]MEE1926231.1 phosphopantetheine-binding protein [Pseudomonas sp. 147P]MEE1937485.1 phosphopantetheine-binding protein [Pseudomonas sp. 148P]
MDTAKVLEIITHYAQLDSPPSTKTTLEDLDMDSIHLLEMTQSFKDQFNVHLQHDDILLSSSVADILAVLKKRGA